jgi:acyl dehydratase
MTHRQKTARSRSYDEVSVGELLPGVSVMITLQRLVMEAGVNRDFSPWHFDSLAARSSGAEGPFASTTLIETLLEAGIRDWAGLSPRIRMLEFAMMVPNCVGDEVRARGIVTSKRTDGARELVDVDIWLESHRGRTVEGSATVAF